MKTICECGYSFEDEGKDIKRVMQTYSNGAVHAKAVCPKCGEIQRRSLPQTEFVETLEFGKYKGHKIEDIAMTHPDYITWLLNQDKMELSSRMRRSLEHFNKGATR